jgi:hypothetical protein
VRDRCERTPRECDAARIRECENAREHCENTRHRCENAKNTARMRRRENSRMRECERTLRECDAARMRECENARLRRCERIPLPPLRKYENATRENVARMQECKNAREDGNTREDDKARIPREDNKSR